jgi:RNA polymerase sigma-70 factor (ECF subfamily)
MRRIGLGDESALQELRSQTCAVLTKYIRRIVKDYGHAEEVLQDVYTYTWLHARDYRGDRATPWSWLCMLARSRALDRFRRLRRDSGASEFDERVHNAPAHHHFPDSAEVWQHSQLRSAVCNLPLDQRCLIRLAFFDGFSHSEIAIRTGLPLGTVKTRIRVALIRLRERMPDENRLQPAA